MGSRARIVLYAQNEPTARDAAAAAFARLAALDAILSDYRQDSEINRLCAQAPGVWTPVSTDLFRVLSRSRALAERTDGAFDHTVGPLTGCWREAKRSGRLPETNELMRMHERVGWDLVSLREAAMAARLDVADMRVDFGAIGKGYGADAALETMAMMGVERAVVDLGGDIAVGAPPPGESAWRITIDTGYAEDQRPVVQAVRCGVATSGDTEQYIELGGVRYSHILDPRTGIGLTSRTAATVIAPDATTADALASAVCVLGPEEAVRLLGDAPGLGVRMMVDGRECRFGQETRRIAAEHASNGGE